MKRKVTNSTRRASTVSRHLAKALFAYSIEYSPSKLCQWPGSVLEGAYISTRQRPNVPVVAKTIIKAPNVLVLAASYQELINFWRLL